MRFRILGRVQVDGVGRLEPRDQRTLAALLLTPNALVTRTQLIDAVWQDDPPATVGRQIFNAVSRLRRLLGGGTIRSDGVGYRIAVAPGELDAQVFAHLLDEAAVLRDGGHAVEAAQRLREALGLWRGPALAGLSGRRLEAGAARLEELRLDALESCLDLELAQGSHAPLIGELTGFVDAHPLRERGVGLLMTALARGGRQAEALARYRELARGLADELGIDPSPPLQRLHESILRGGTPDAAVAPRQLSTTIVPRQLPAAVRHFVGRRAELDELDALLAEVGGDGLVIAAIDGMPGVGKTTLALHWAHVAAPSFPDGQLHVDLRGFEPSGEPVSAAEAVRGFLDALGVPANRVPADPAARAALYRSLLAGRRMLVLLDNARDADHVRPLLPGTPTCLVLVTSRNRLTELAVEHAAYQINVDLFSRVESRDLLSTRLGRRRVHAEPEAVHDLVTACARLPLALAVVAARAAAYPGFPLTTLAEELAAWTGETGNVFAWSYQQLTPAAAGLFRLLGLHPGGQIGIAAAAGLAGIPPDRAHALAAELARANLVTMPARDRIGLHDLLRAYAAELALRLDADGVRDAATLRLLDHYLHTAYATDRLLHPNREPLELEPHRPDVTPEQPRDHKWAHDWFHTEHSVLMAVIRSAAETGRHRHTWQLAWIMSNHLDRQGNWQEEIDCQRTALSAARALADPHVEARVHRQLARAYTRLHRFGDAHAHLRQTLELATRAADVAGQAHAITALARLHARQGEQTRALAYAERALSLYETVGNRSWQANALNTIGWLYIPLGNYRQALAFCRRALVMHEELGNRLEQAYVLDSIGYAHHHLGRHRQAIAAYLQALRLHRSLGEKHAEARVLHHLGDSLHAAGLIGAGRRAYRAALDILEDLDHPDLAVMQAKLASPPP